MKAIEFMLARAGMCKYYGGVMGGCTRKNEKCPLSDIDCDITADMQISDAEKMQAIVEKWAHREDGTNEDKFKAVFGLEAVDIFTLCSVNFNDWLKQKYEDE